MYHARFSFSTRPAQEAPLDGVVVYMVEEKIAKRTCIEAGDMKEDSLMGEQKDAEDTQTLKQPFFLSLSLFLYIHRMVL